MRDQSLLVVPLKITVLVIVFNVKDLHLRDCRALREEDAAPTRRFAAGVPAPVSGLAQHRRHARSIGRVAVGRHARVGILWLFALSSRSATAVSISAKPHWSLQAPGHSP